MKIYIIGQKGIPAVGGGVETHVDNLAAKLVELGHDVFAYTRRNYTEKTLKSYKGIKLISLPSINTNHLDAISHTFLACLDFVFKRRKADVLHFHSIGPASLIWLVKLFRPKTKIVFTFHSQCYYNTKWGKLAKIYLSFGERVGCLLADEVIVVSKSLKNYVENKYQRKVNYIPNGVSLPKKEDAKLIKEKWNLKKDSYVLSVSRIVKNKGLEYLVEVFKNLNTNKKLVIVGDGNFKEELELLADNKENIIFTGRQSGSTLNELYSNAALFVQPSEAEGLSISLLEAASYQLAILISNIEANLEVMGEDSFSFENKNVEDLKNKITSFLNNENREGLDKNLKMVYNKILSEYNWDNIIKETVKLYKAL